MEKLKHKNHTDVTDRPDLYDWLYQDRSVSLYFSLAETHSELLECGIGTGRIAIPLAEKGKVVYGIDNSTAMLDRLELNVSKLGRNIRDRIHAYHADMRNFDLGQKFSLIVVSFASFNYLLTLDDQKSSLQVIKKHLSEEGILVLVVLSYSAFPDLLQNDTAIRKIVSRVDPVTNERIELWRVARFDASTQIIEQDRYFKTYDANGKLKDESILLWRNRFFLIGELQLLLESIGFEVTEILDNHSLGTYTHSTGQAVVKAKIKKS